MPSRKWLGLELAPLPALQNSHVPVGTSKRWQSSQVRTGGSFRRGGIFWEFQVGKNLITFMITSHYKHLPKGQNTPTSLWHQALTLHSKMCYHLGVWEKLVLICKRMGYFEKQPNTESKANKHPLLPNGTRGRGAKQWYFVCLLPKATGFLSHLF